MSTDLAQKKTKVQWLQTTLREPIPIVPEEPSWKKDAPEFAASLEKHGFMTSEQGLQEEGYGGFGTDIVDPALSKAVNEKRAVTAAEWTSSASTENVNTLKQEAKDKAQEIDDAEFSVRSNQETLNLVGPQLQKRISALEQKGGGDPQKQQNLQRKVDKHSQSRLFVRKKTRLKKLGDYQQALQDHLKDADDLDKGKQFLADLETDVTDAESNLQTAKLEYRAACLKVADHPSKNPERAAVGQLLTELEDIKTNQLDGKAKRKQLEKKFTELERKAYEWSDRRAKEHLPPSPGALALLDSIQAAHKAVIDQVVANNEELPLPDGIDAEEARKAQDDWRHLVAADGNIKIDENRYNPADDTQVTETVAGYKSELLAHMARLLAIPSGRNMINQLMNNPGNDPDKVVMIRPQTASEKQKSGFDGTATGVNEYGGEQPKDTSSLQNVKESERGKGVGSKVTMPQGMGDSSVVAYDEDGNLIVSPAFLVLGHELIHAKHNLTGRNRNAVPMSEEKAKVWKNPEEKHTIKDGKTTEQTMRNEVGLTRKRFGHTKIERKDERLDKKLGKVLEG
jgi:hypothetical protein